MIMPISTNRRLFHVSILTGFVCMTQVSTLDWRWPEGVELDNVCKKLSTVPHSKQVLHRCQFAYGLYPPPPSEFSLIWRIRALVPGSLQDPGGSKQTLNCLYESFRHTWVILGQHCSQIRVKRKLFPGPQNMGRQSFSIKGKRVNILGFAGYLESLSHILLCIFFFFLQPFKKCKAILTLQVIQKQAMGGFGPQAIAHQSLPATCVRFPRPREWPGNVA